MRKFTFEETHKETGGKSVIEISESQILLYLGISYKAAEYEKEEAIADFCIEFDAKELKVNSNEESVENQDWEYSYAFISAETTKAAFLKAKELSNTDPNFAFLKDLKRYYCIAALDDVRKFLTTKDQVINLLSNINIPSHRPRTAFALILGKGEFLFFNKERNNKWQTQRLKQKA